MAHHPVREALLTLALQPRNLARRLSGLLPGAAAQAVTVVAMDGQWLKVLQVTGQPQARKITKLFACPVAGKAPAEVYQLFQEACATEGLAAREILIANPAHLSTIRLFSLPSTDPKEIRDIVELQAEKHTPYAKEEILFDFSVISRERSGYSRVLLVIAHQDVIHRAVGLVEAAGLTLERMGSELEGLLNWWLAVKRRAGGSAAASLVMEIDGSTSTLIVMHQGQLQFHRTLATGAEHLQDDPPGAGERLVAELQRSLEALETEGITAKPQEVVVTGRIERFGELKGRLEQGLGLPVTLRLPWEGQELPESVRKACEQLPDVSFASLLGLTLGPSDIDLTPQATKLRHGFEARAKALVLLACQGVAALVLITLILIGRVQKEQRYYHVLRAAFQQSDEETAQLTDALVQLGFVEKRLRHRGDLLEAVQALAQLTPPEIRWSGLTFVNDEGLVLKGSSEALPKVYEFVAALDTLPLFGQVEARRVSKSRAEGPEATDFEIFCPLASAEPGAAAS